MKTKKGFTLKKIILAALLIAGLLSITLYVSSKAQNYPSILKMVEENIPGVDIFGSNQKYPTQEPVAASDVIMLIDKMKSRKVEYESWVHIVSNVTSEADSGVVLPDGQPMPSSYVQDDWFYLNEDGLVEKGVFTVTDFDGAVLQQSAFQNNIMFNFTFDIREENRQSYPLNIDFGFVNRVTDAEKMGLVIKKSEEEKEGKTSVVYTYVEKLEKPTEIGNVSKKVDSITIKGYFDKTSEDFWLLQTILTLDTGEEVIFDSTTIVSIESFSKAPDEILAVLEGVK